MRNIASVPSPLPDVPRCPPCPHHEDYDYSARLARAGLWHMQVPEARFYHGPKGTRWMSGSTRAIMHQGRRASPPLGRLLGQLRVSWKRNGCQDQGMDKLRTEFHVVNDKPCY